MKKNTIIILTLILITTLTGCFKDSKKTKSEDNTIQFISSTASYYKNGAAFSNNQSMLFLDFDTMKTSPLCAKPNCTHTTSECLANVVGTTPIFYNDSIYYFDYKANVKETTDDRIFYIESKLMKASLDSSETEVVCEFTDCTPNDEYVLMDNALYFVGCDQNPQNDDYGNFTWSDVGGIDYLCSINLDTGKYINYGNICNVEDMYPAADSSSSSKILGCYKNKIYIGHSFLKEEPQAGKTNNWTLLNFEFDLKNQSIIKSNLPYPFYADNDTYVCYDREAKYFNVIYKDKELIIPSEHEIVNCTEFNGKLFMPSVGKWYDLSDCSEHSMGEYEGYDVIAYYDNSYILLYQGLTAKITEEELLTLE